MSKKNYNRIKAVLAEQGKSNKKLAKLLGVAGQTVSRWCTNSGQATAEMLFKIARMFRRNVKTCWSILRGKTASSFVHPSLIFR